MKVKVLLGLLLVLAGFGPAAAQTPQSTPAPDADRKKAATATATPAAANQSWYVRPDAATRRKNYFQSIFGPAALARTVVGAGFATARNAPEEWGGQWEGFGRRVASNFGRNAIRQTTTYALDEAFKLDSRFYRSRSRSFGAKVKNALLSPVTARDRNGRRVFGLPRIAGTYAGSVIAAETWFPKRFDYKDGLRNGTLSLGFSAAFNLVRELFRK